MTGAAKLILSALAVGGAVGGGGTLYGSGVVGSQSSSSGAPKNSIPAILGAKATYKVKINSQPEFTLECKNVHDKYVVLNIETDTSDSSQNSRYENLKLECLSETNWIGRGPLYNQDLEEKGTDSPFKCLFKGLEGGESDPKVFRYECKNGKTSFVGQKVEGDHPYISLKKQSN
ncbi:hypothetical protein MHLP_03900 [Candidatus Mycoplasma haematolamae str. Purdue]|uniref:Uncharacterized protein n=1 Tax=Mycoplasma haematolamae (strain Purdue) TaxID=1212765 RepID=I7BAL3_MYCHA|nr:hypothetical protein [Candidatus Mycoplasma haematolamae]AFO52360.1 hypothetical protein MHLP_03900 [Candidatus Mycoplasma haematolamae str. Purdue]